jgi:hypothetical protein
MWGKIKNLRIEENMPNSSTERSNVPPVSYVPSDTDQTYNWKRKFCGCFFPFPISILNQGNGSLQPHGAVKLTVVHLLKNF